MRHPPADLEIGRKRAQGAYKGARLPLMSPKIRRAVLGLLIMGILCFLSPSAPVQLIGNILFVLGGSLGTYGILRQRQNPRQRPDRRLVKPRREKREII